MKTYSSNSRTLVLRKEKIGTVIITAIMILSALTILTISTQPANAAAGSVTYDPSVFSSGQSTLVVANGGTFTADSTVYFYISSTTSFGSSSPQIGSYTLTSGATSLSNSVFHLTISETPGTYYIAASDDNRATFTSAFPITITALSPSITVANSAATAGGAATVSGFQFDPGSTVNIYLQYAGGQVVATNVEAASGYFTTTVNIPSSLTQTTSTYYLVAQEVSSNSLNSGVTASTSFTAQASISVSPKDVSPSATSTVVINGYGFYPGATVSANSVAMSPSSGSVSGIKNGATTVGVNGEVSITATFNSVSANGPISIGVTTTPASSYSSFASAFYVSQTNATNLKFTFSVTPTIGTTYNVGSSSTATVYNFPASQTVQVFLGSTTVASLTTDSNGFGQATASIPAIPGNSYSPTAEVNSLGLYKQASPVQISSDFLVSSPGNVMLTSSPTTEYIPSSALLTVSAFGLNPTTAYNIDDSLVAPSGVYSGSSGNLETSITIGTAGTSGLYPASNGTLIFTYSPGYSTSTTGTSSTITMTNSVSAYHSYTFGYRTVGTPSITSPSSFNILTQGATGTNLVVSRLIPFESPVYPGTSYYYATYIGPTQLSLTFSGLTSTMFYASGGTFSGTFKVPYLAGALELNVTYSNGTYSNSIGSQYVVVSLAGTSYSSGTLQVLPLSTAGSYEVVGYGYYLKNPTLFYTTYSGPLQVGTETLTNGAFAVQISPGSSIPAGKYSVFTELSSSGVTYFVYSSYTVVANLTLSAYSGPIGTTITVNPASTGLITTSFYNVYFGTGIVLTDTGLTLDTGSPTFKVPTVVAGNYEITVVPMDQRSAVESAGFALTSNSNIVLGTDSSFAFPGQLVTFSVSGFTAPSTPPGATAVGSATSYVTVELNSSDYQTVQAYYDGTSHTLAGSFVMPNDNPGAYYELTLTAFEIQPVSYTIGTTSPTTGYGSVTLAYSGSQSDFLGLISGNGALVTGISQSQIAQLETDMNATLSVPVSQLDASVTSIQNSVAQINTAFGTMQASLNTIDATVTSINSGVATLQTTLGQVSTSLSSLNATVVALNNDTATISTSIGKFTTTINNINATVTIGNGNIATIKTDLGTFTGNVTSVSNGIATIQTTLGTIKTNTNQIVPSYGTSFLIEILTLILVVVAVVFSALAMMNTRKKF